MTSWPARLTAAVAAVRRETARRWAVIYNPAPRRRIGPPPGEGVISGVEYQAPHCDADVLHQPATCRYCDAFPAAQRARYEAGINFTGQHNPTLKPCPSEVRRPLEVIERWAGNRSA